MPQLPITSATIEFASGSITNDMVRTPTGSDLPIIETKLRPLYKPGTNFDLAIGGTVANREEIVFVAHNTGLVKAAKAILNDTGTTGSTNFDVKKNGTTILTGDIQIANTDANRSVISGTLSDTDVSAGDVFSIELDNTGSGDGTGPFAWIEIAEEG